MPSKKRPIRLSVFDTEGTTITDDPRGLYAVLYNWDMLDLIEGVDPSLVTVQNLHTVTERHEGRDCLSLYEYLTSELDSAIECGYVRKVGIHNISYDYAYLRRWLQDMKASGYEVEACARSSTKLLTIKISSHGETGMILFDTLAIAAKSLRSLGEALGFPKERIDYSERIAPDSRYAEGNEAYNHRDTDILMIWICTSLLKNPHVTLEDLGTRVLTKTSIVRKADREDGRIGAMPLSLRKSRGSGKRSRRRKPSSKDMTVYKADRLITEKYQYETMEQYERWTSYGASQTGTPGCFAGGVNISNARCLGVIMHDVISYDLKSAYPSVMLSMAVPVDPCDVPADQLHDYASLLDPVAPSPVDLMSGRMRFWRGTVRMEDVRLDAWWEEHVGDTSITQAMILQHRGDDERVRWRDGHFDGADVLYVTVALPEWLEICLQWDWGRVEFTELTVYGGYQAPTHYTVLRTLHHYREKSESKALMKLSISGKLDQSRIDAAERDSLVTHDEALELARNPDDEWLRAFVLSHKGNLNALYGILVTSPMKDDFDLSDDEWLVTLDKDEEKAMADYAASSRDSKMWREAGVMVALYNRYKICYMMSLLADDGATVVYVDTDSIKFTGVSKERADEIFAKLHDEIESRTNALVSACVSDVREHVERYNAQTGLSIDPPSIPDDDEFRALGKLDYEGTYERFVTMGHKKYAAWEPDRTGRKRWAYRCSGYSTRVLMDLGSQLETDGMSDVSPLIVLGYDNRLDSRTGIATLESSIEPTWVTATIEGAVDVTGGTSTHTWTGETCPGYAIIDAGKIMNNTQHSAMNRQRYLRACMNNPKVSYLSNLDITWFAGTYVYGPRGSIDMAWQDWGLKTDEEQSDALI